MRARPTDAHHPPTRRAAQDYFKKGLISCAEGGRVHARVSRLLAFGQFDRLMILPEPKYSQGGEFLSYWRILSVLPEICLHSLLSSLTLQS